MFWRGTFKRCFFETKNRVIISLNGIFYAYIVGSKIKLWYLGLMIASKIKKFEFPILIFWY